MNDFLLGTVLVIMFFVGMIWLCLRAGLFQEFIEEVKGWKEDYLEWKIERVIKKGQKKKRARK